MGSTWGFDTVFIAMKSTVNFFTKYVDPNVLFSKVGLYYFNAII